MTARFLLPALLLIACSNGSEAPDPSEPTEPTTTEPVAPVAPTVSFVAPADGASFTVGEPVRIEARAVDGDEADLQGLTLTWSGAGAEGGPEHPDSSGTALFFADGLPAGSATLAVTVTDSTGLTGTAAVAFTVVDGVVDVDGDGSPAGDDCDDGDDTVYPGAPEVCDGVDQDCDNEVDEGVLVTFYEDADGDGYGDAASSTEACAAPVGFVIDGTDCDDLDATVNPGAAEQCDAVDHDCDGAPDNDIVDLPWYADADGDGYGDPDAETLACAMPVGHVADGSDCDDADPTVSPAAAEVCDGVDQDCDLAVDEGVEETFWLDADLDGYGDPTATTTACTVPAGYAENADDCDDALATIHPGAVEVCDGVDQDCDLAVDEGVEETFWLDADLDGYGDPAVTTTACAVPAGYAENAEDCDDALGTVNPLAAETCNGVDDDCSGVIDDGPGCGPGCPVYADPGVLPGGDGAYDAPFPSIAYAMAFRPVDCDEIALFPGTYDENVDYGGDDLVIFSLDGPATTVLTSTVGGSIVTFSGGETAAATLSGVTVTGGSATNGGGIHVTNASPTITDCIIEGNTATVDGGGLYGTGYHGLFVGNVVRNNTASDDGGGLYLDASDGTVQGNDLTGNHAGDEGGAVAVYGGIPLLDANEVTSNTTDSQSGGLYLDDTSAVVTNNLLVGNGGAGIYLYDATDGVIANNTVATSGYAGLRTYQYPTASVVNNIFYSSGSYDVYFYTGSSQASLIYENNDAWGSPYGYYNENPDPTGLDGNISVDPQFVGGGDYSLSWGSRAIDGGQDAAGLGVVAAIDGTARPLGAAWDIGAYESYGTPPDCAVDPSYCATSCPVYVDASALPGGDGSAASPYPSIGYAMTYGQGCTEIVLEPGVYDENVDYGGLDWQITSTGGPAVTEITSSVGGSVITIAGNQTAAAELSGVTVSGGLSAYGGGIYVSGADPTIRDVILDGNTATVDGGGLYGTAFDGVFEGSVVQNSDAGDDGGGIYLDGSAATVRGNEVLVNHAGDEGGAVAVYGGTPHIEGNTLSSNTTDSQSGGIYLDDTAPTVVNNLLVGNGGAGIYLYDATSGAVANNTVVSSGYAGLRTYQYPTTSVVNNIFQGSGSYDVYFYTGSSQASLTYESNLAWGSPYGYYNENPDPTGLDGNISVDPQFVGGGDYSLAWGSRAIDGGQDASALGVTADLDGAARPLGAAWDIGAYESYGTEVDCAAGGGYCATACPIHVDASVEPGGNGDPLDPYPSIAYAMTYGGGCLDIVLEPGVYDENVDFGALDYSISSTGGAAVTEITSTVGGSVIRIAGGQTPAAELSGVTVSGGLAPYGGGIYVSGADPTIRDVIVRGNTATVDGGGVYGDGFDGVLEASVVQDNDAGDDGGGVFLDVSAATLLGNEIATNHAGDEGGAVAVYGGSPTLAGNELTSNTTDSQSGGIYLDDTAPTVVNNLLVGNGGAGVYLYDATSGVLANNTVVSSGYAGLRTYQYPTTSVVNNIFQGSGSYDVYFYTGSSQASLTYESNLAWGSPYGYYNENPDPTGLDGNISVDPMFAVGGYTLAWGSRAIDGGQDAALLGVVGDIDGNLRGLGPAWDIGAYETWGADPDCTLGGPYCATGCPVYADAAAVPGGDGTAADPFPNVAYAMTYGNGCTEIVLEPGTYDENVDFGTTDWSLTSTAGAAATVIDSSVGGHVVTIAGGQSPAALLSGVTLRGGLETYGGGLYVVDASPTIVGNILDGNEATVDGAGFYGTGFGGVFEGNVLQYNTAGDDGGGVYLDGSTGTVRANELYANHAGDEGGAVAVYGGSPTIERNTVTSNTTDSQSGGLYLDDTAATVVNNLLVGNGGAGVYLYDATSGVLANNTVATSGYAGLRTYQYPTTTIVNNVFYSSGSYDVYFYTGSSQASLTYEDNDAWGSPYGYYNESPDPTGLDGNISVDPQFVGGGDYSLVWGSACVDSGQTAGALGVSDDLFGTGRPLGLGYDMGAIESW